MAATRWALYAERMTPLLRSLEEIQATPLPTEPAAKLAVAKSKTAAGQAIPLLREVLLLDG